MKNILIRPLVTEKSELASEELNQYTFIVNKKANKIEIAKAIKDTYSVEVVAVNTVNVAAKSRSRMTRSGVIKGRKSGYKKAIVTVYEGDTIDFYGNV